MSENRFWFVIDKGKLDYVQDNVTNEKITVSELEDLLNDQQSRIKELEKENTELKKQIEDCKDYNSILYKNCLQKDRKRIKEVKRVEEELEECIKENAKLREMYINDE